MFIVNKDGKVRVGYTKNGKVVWLPRSETRHLDGQPDHNIKYWTDERAAKLGLTHSPTREIHPALTKYLASYESYLIDRERAEKTRRAHLHYLRNFIFPYFLQSSPDGHNPNYWPQRVPGLAAWARGRLLQGSRTRAVNNTIRVINVVLRQFWVYLGESGELETQFALRVRNPPGLGRKKRTPLRQVLTPQDVLAWVQTTQNIDLRMLALVGYFFSLRPQEVFAFTKAGCRAGKSAKQLECCGIMKKSGLFGKLAYYVKEQRNDKGEVGPPKAFSVGWVACFDRAAARQIVDIINEKDPFAPVFAQKGMSLYRLWKRQGMPGVTLKDLRRASIYWLGHHTSLPPAAIQNHARHAEAETTQWYLRRPDEEVVSMGTLDLDA